MAEPTSPNTGNYYVGKGNLYFKKTGDGSSSHMGNCPSFKLSPSTNTLDHFSSMAGIKSKDRSIIIEKTLVATVVLDEITIENLALFLFGTVNTAGNAFGIFDVTEVTGELTFVGSNDVGDQFTIACGNCSIKPTGDFDLISDAFGQVQLTIDILFDSGAGSFGTVTESGVATSI